MVRVFNITCRRVFCGRISPCDCISQFPIKRGNHQPVTGSVASHWPGKTQLFVSSYWNKLISIGVKPRKTLTGRRGKDTVSNQLESHLAEQSQTHSYKCTSVAIFSTDEHKGRCTMIIQLKTKQQENQNSTGISLLWYVVSSPGWQQWFMKSWKSLNNCNSFSTSTEFWTHFVWVFVTMCNKIILPKHRRGRASPCSAIYNTLLE